MDLYFKNDYIKTRGCFTSSEIVTFTKHRITLLQICVSLKKYYAKGFPKDIHAILKTELITRNVTELKYLIDDYKQLNDEQCNKNYLSWFTLITMCVLLTPKMKWIKEMEENFVSVMLANYSDEDLKAQWLNIPKNRHRFHFATVEDFVNASDYYDKTKTYVKVHYTKIPKTLLTICDILSLYIKNGYYFIEFEKYIRELFTCLIEVEWTDILHECLMKYEEVEAMYNREVLEQISDCLEVKIQGSIQTQVENIPKEVLPLQDLPNMSKQYFPPCMTTMLDYFNEHGDLKHDSRKQLLLFLKDINVPKSDIMNLVKINYSRPHLADKRIEVQYFMNHLLGITYPTNYRSYNCKQIQEHPIMEGFPHGCYFKRLTRTQMEYDMIDLRFSPEDINLVLGKLTEDGYSAACTAHLQTRSKLDKMPFDMDKPNDYYCIARCRGELEDIEDLCKQY